jgi:hypothetical protein
MVDGAVPELDEPELGRIEVERLPEEGDLAAAGGGVDPVAGGRQPACEHLRVVRVGFRRVDLAGEEPRADERSHAATHRRRRSANRRPSRYRAELDE